MYIKTDVNVHNKSRLPLHLPLFLTFSIGFQYQFFFWSQILVPRLFFFYTVVVIVVFSLLWPPSASFPAANLFGLFVYLNVREQKPVPVYVVVVEIARF